MTNHKPLNVVAAIIENPQGQLLIAERPADKAWAGYWEFPGGKIEPGGTEVILDFYYIRLTRDIAPQGLEGQRWRWVSRAELTTYRFPEPNTAVLQKLQNASS